MSDQKLYIDQFVGRESLLQTIYEAIADVTNNYAIFLLGKGGMGKTTLFRHVHQIYQRHANIVVLPLDMSEASGSNLGSIIEVSMKIAFESGILTAEDKIAIYEMYAPVLQAIDKGFAESEIVKLQKSTYEAIFKYANSAFKSQGRELLFSLIL